MSRLLIPIEEQKNFWLLSGNIKINKIKDCWLWLGSLNSDGYGSIKINKKYIGIHCYSYYLMKGDILENLQVLHKCDIRSCVNPEHLFLGTQEDNIHDCMSKDRGNYSARGARGQNQHLALLTNEIVIEARKLAERIGQWPAAREIAEQTGISEHTIRKAIIRQTWKHVK